MQHPLVHHLGAGTYCCSRVVVMDAVELRTVQNDQSFPSYVLLLLLAQYIPSAGITIFHKLIANYYYYTEKW